MKLNTLKTLFVGKKILVPLHWALYMMCRVEMVSSIIYREGYKKIFSGDYIYNGGVSNTQLDIILHELGTFQDTQPISKKINFAIRVWFRLTPPPWMVKDHKKILFFFGPFP